MLCLGVRHDVESQNKGREEPVSDFKTLALKDLAEQTRFAPSVRRQAQATAALKLYAEIELGKTYPYQYVCFRVTDYRSDSYPDLMIRGSDLRHDLELFARRVEKSVPPLPIEQAVEPMLTLDEVSKRFNVSTKTISRWRVKGLAARRVKVGGRSQLGFPRTAVEKFVGDHQSLVAKGAKFSHLTEAEKDDILQQARELRDVGATLTEVSKQIATKLGRSPEAVRYTIKNFDRGHPDHSLFPAVAGPLSAAAKEQIVLAMTTKQSAKLTGEPVAEDTVETLAKRFNRTRSSLYRVVNEVRAKELVRQNVDYIYNAEFDEAEKEAVIITEMPALAEFEGKRNVKTIPKDVPPQMMHLYEWPLLTKDQEQHVFRKMNFLKHQLQKFQEALDPTRARVADLLRIEDLREGIKTCRDTLINCNQRLVYANAKKHLGPTESIDDLVSDGNLSLMRAVEKFDYGRGNKFSTYATWAIIKNFARSIPDAKTHKQRYMTGHEELFEAKADIRTDEQEVLAAADSAKARVARLLEHLDARTREVIRMRTGIDGSQEMTLEQIGQHFGITKERVRQINVRGMKQLREWAAKDNVEAP